MSYLLNKNDILVLDYAGIKDDGNFERMPAVMTQDDYQRFGGGDTLDKMLTDLIQMVTSRQQRGFFLTAEQFYNCLASIQFTQLGTGQETGATGRLEDEVKFWRHKRESQEFVDIWQAQHTYNNVLPSGI